MAAGTVIITGAAGGFSGSSVWVPPPSFQAVTAARSPASRSVTPPN